MDDNMLGMPFTEIDTPALVIDLDVMEANIAVMADFFARTKAKLRPHVKTHKTPALAHKQIVAGAIGMTCAKLGEAEVMAESGIKDILIANQVVGRGKISRLVDLAKKADMMVAVDDLRNAGEISEVASGAGASVRVLVEVNTGINRCGVEPGKPALELARKVFKLPGLRFSGVMGYEGHAVGIKDFNERSEVARKSMKLLTETADVIRDGGIEVRIVSGGGTGTYNISGVYPGVTEIQAGSYILMDVSYNERCPEFGCALTVLTTVVSITPSQRRVVTDAGLKSMTKDFGMPGVKGYPDLSVMGLSEEHVRIEDKSGRCSLKVGDKIELIPNHVCTTVNLHDRFYGVRKGKVEAIWPIAARGRFD